MTTTRRVLLLAAVTVAAVAAVLLLTDRADDRSTADAGSAAGDGHSPATPDGVPATSSSASPAPGGTAEPSGQGATDAPPPAAGRSVPVGLTYADWDQDGGRVEAAGFAADVIESGGICTLSLTKEGTRVDATSTAEADATTTNCGLLTVPGDQLSPGIWQVTLAYRSATAQGLSEQMTVTVPAR